MGWLNVNDKFLGLSKTTLALGMFSARPSGYEKKQKKEGKSARRGEEGRKKWKEEEGKKKKNRKRAKNGWSLYTFFLSFAGRGGMTK